MEETIEKFIGDQLSVWPLAAEHYRALKKAETKHLTVNGLDITVQLNPARSISSKAALDPESIRRRPCFLCPENRPEEQFDIPFEGRKGKKYRITLNPFPIFPSHLVISSAGHIPQRIGNRYQDMLDFVKADNGRICFYNGPHSGASAPDHLHFQSCPMGCMPLQVRADELVAADSGRLQALSSIREARLYHLDLLAGGIFLLRAETPKSATKLFFRLLDCADIRPGEEEPRCNVITWRSEGEYRTVVIFREKHRPHHYTATGDEHLAVSPGCADMGGLFVTADEEDFRKLDAPLLESVFREVTLSPEEEARIVRRLTRTQPVLEVGILSAPEIRFEIISDGAGVQTVSYREGKIDYNGVLFDELLFDAQTPSTMFAGPSFTLHDVTIGVNFHWERKMTQQFAGALKFIVEDGRVTAVNRIGVEDYLLSVISSEMKASAGLEFLKTHAVISRSWVMAQIAARKHPAPQRAAAESRADAAENGTYIRWFDHDDHKLFDVCADDHCQRYQGLTMAVGETVRKAIDQTWGLVLTDQDGRICDARFSKCCGGIMERFSTCWEDQDPAYLQGRTDDAAAEPRAEAMDEPAAARWILSSPGAFCNTEDEGVLRQVLNDYDLETKDFYRWQTEYGREELSDLLRRRSGIDWGNVRALLPVERGTSGRLKRLRIVGEKKDLIVGKELIIRKFLSESHLKSSAFVVSYIGAGGEAVSAQEAAAGAPWKTVVLQGAGWGHGVGLCQIGAALMAHRGYGFREILAHYYPGARLQQR